MNQSLSYEYNGNSKLIFDRDKYGLWITNLFINITTRNN